jgi:hypothetical protein
MTMSKIQNNNPELDEGIWQAWIKKNEALDRLRFARRLRILTIVAAVAGLAALLWRFA